MAGFHPHLDDLPTEFPVFPLEGALLLPRGRLPLNIFEPRYLALVEDSLAAGRMFGMIQPDPAQPATPQGPACYRVGCLGRLSSLSETDDGRYLITLTGVIRFHADSELPSRRGYRRFRAEFAAYHDDLRLDQQQIGTDRATLVAALRGYFSRRGFEANWDTIRKIADDMLVITLSMICPFEPAEKQALLEAPTEADRAATLLALLRMGAVADGSPNHVVS